MYGRPPVNPFGRRAGGSEQFHGGFVTYTKENKIATLGVPRELIAAYTAGSRPVAEAMAMGALDRCPADMVIAITGVAGPEPDEDGNPVGLMHIATAVRGRGMRIDRRHAQRAAGTTRAPAPCMPPWTSRTRCSKRWDRLVLARVSALEQPATAVALGVVATVSDEELWRHLDIIASLHLRAGVPVRSYGCPGGPHGGSRPEPRT